MKKQKTDLRPDSVDSSAMHVGIELELCVAGESAEHDDEMCSDNYRGELEEQNTVSLLRNYLDTPRDAAERIADYFDRDQFISNEVDSHECGDPQECSARSEGDTREEFRRDLRRLTGNSSFKVVEDGSVRTNDGEIDAEVCWNYFISKDTVKDNARILAYLKDKGARFDTSCGLHINLNNYLSVPSTAIPTHELGFLFNLVAPSRSLSTYCNTWGMSGSEKYSMLYNQGDRIEFRFFSPTLDPVKLNHYVATANVVYRRLAGKNAKLPKKTWDYLLQKMTTVNGLTIDLAVDTLNRINLVRAAQQYVRESGESGSEE